MTVKSMPGSSTKAKPASMAVFARPGDAKPSGDVHPRGEDTSKPSASAPLAVATVAAASNEQQPAPATQELAKDDSVKETVVATAPVVAAAALPGASSAMDLAVMLQALQNTTEEPGNELIHKVSLNVKVPKELADKLVQLVGYYKYRGSKNFSQQDYLESRLATIIEYEHAKIPKF